MKKIKEILKALAMVLDTSMPHLFYHLSIADPETEASACISNLEKEKMISFLKYQLEQVQNMSADKIEIFEGDEIFETERGTEH